MGLVHDPGQLANYAAAGPPEHGLPAIRRLRGLLDEWETQQVRAARAFGWNWGEIGRVLGRSRQAVHARYRSEPTDDEARPPTEWERREASRMRYEQKLRGELTSEEWLRAERASWDRPQ